MAVTLRFQSTGAIPGKGEPVPMRGQSLTIGRGDENDLALPDPDRLLSKRHCVVENHNGNVVVVDISTNGTFLNYGKVALGSTPTPLNDGDILSLGPYELLVEISTDKSKDPMAGIADPLADGPVSHGDANAAPGVIDLLDGPSDKGDFLDDLLGGPDLPAGPKGVKREQLGDDGLLPPLGSEDDLLPPLEDDPQARQGASQGAHSPASQDHFAVRGAGGGANVIPDDWDLDMQGGGSAGAHDPFAKPGPTPPSTGAGGAAFIPDDEVLGDPGLDAVPDVPAPKPAPQPRATPQPTAAAVSPGADEAAARAFLDALGVEGLRVENAALAPTMARMGNVMRVMIQGLREILMTRTSIKSEFRIDQTQISAGANNPLKFSISPEQAVQAMVQPMTKGYLDATEAAEQALSDIKAHEVAMVTGMEAALKGVLKRLDPELLEEKMSSDSKLGSLLKSKKARYWEVYKEMFAQISDQAENDFHELFSKEFARAYKEQLDRLK
ncbi:MAG: type VI secretion system-associated FHA domain protein TagH [Paracoccaceae bacterium]